MAIEKHIKDEKPFFVCECGYEQFEKFGEFYLGKKRVCETCFSAELHVIYTD